MMIIPDNQYEAFVIRDILREHDEVHDARVVGEEHGFRKHDIQALRVSNLEAAAYAPEEIRAYRAMAQRRMEHPHHLLKVATEILNADLAVLHHAISAALHHPSNGRRLTVRGVAGKTGLPIEMVAAIDRLRHPLHLECLRLRAREEHPHDRRRTK